MIARRLLPLAACLMLYLAITLVALNALIVNFTTALPGIVNIQAADQIQPSEFDIFAWNLWWVRHAVFDLRVSPLYTDYVVYPFVSPLAGHTLALLWGLASAPFQAAFGLIRTFNAIVVFNFVAAAALMALFARRHMRHAGAALLAGLIFAYTPAMIHRASLGHLDKISIFWLPLSLLLWDKVVESRRWTWAVTLGACLYLSWLTDFQQTMWALCLLVPYALFTGMIQPRRHTGARAVLTTKAPRHQGFRGFSSCLGVLVVGFRTFFQKLRVSVPLWLILIASAAFIIPALFAPLPQLAEANRLNYPPARLEDTADFGFPLQNFLTPGDNGDFSIGRLLPILTLISILFIRWRIADGGWRIAWLWLDVAVACFLLALGPYLDIGTARIPLPYALVHPLLGNQYRTPMRFATPGVFALAMLVALTLDRALDRIEGPARSRPLRVLVVAALLAGFVVDYRLGQPFPITRMPDYRAYHDIASAPGDFAVLEIPTGVRTGFAIVGRGEYLQYYQTIHHRPIPTGYLSRLPNEIMDFFFTDPLVGALTLSRALPPQAEADAGLEQLIRDWKIGAVILHRDMLEPGRVKAFGDLLDRQPALERVGEEGPLVVYRARAP